MEIQDWNVKNLYYLPSERKSAAKYASGLLKKGWELNMGGIVDGGLFGDKTPNGFMDDYEEVQIQIVRPMKSKLQS